MVLVVADSEAEEVGEVSTVVAAAVDTDSVVLSKNPKETLSGFCLVKDIAEPFCASIGACGLPHPIHKNHD